MYRRLKIFGREVLDLERWRGTEVERMEGIGGRERRMCEKEEE